MKISPVVQILHEVVQYIVRESRSVNNIESTIFVKWCFNIGHICQIKCWLMYCGMLPAGFSMFKRVHKAVFMLCTFMLLHISLMCRFTFTPWHINGINTCPHLSDSFSYFTGIQFFIPFLSREHNSEPVKYSTWRKRSVVFPIHSIDTMSTVW